VGKKRFWSDRVDPAVCRINCVCVNQPKGVKAGAKHGFLGRDVKRHDVDPIRESWQYRKTSKKRQMDIGCDPGLPYRWKQGHEAIKGGKVDLANRRVLKEDHRGVCASLLEGLK